MLMKYGRIWPYVTHPHAIPETGSHAPVVGMAVHYLHARPKTGNPESHLTGIRTPNSKRLRSELENHYAING